MAISREVLITQRDIAMEKGYLTQRERETFEKYIDSAVETNPTHLTDRSTSSTRKKRSRNTASRVYDVVSKTPIDDYVATGGREVVEHQIDKEVSSGSYSTFDLSGGFNDMIDTIGDGEQPKSDSGKILMFGIGAVIILSIFGT